MSLTAPDDVLHTFRQWGWSHLAILAGIVVTACLLPRGRKWLVDGPARRRLDVFLGVLGLATWLACQAVEWLPGRFDPEHSYPFHLCDVVALVAPLALLVRWRVLRAVLYYWGIGLSTQALFQPELTEGVASPLFWGFWLSHGMIVVAAAYDLAARGYRPGWEDYGLALLALAAYIAAVLPFDLAWELNYGFIGRGRPGQATPLDFLGPWPLRAIRATVGAFLFLALITVPWVVAARRRAAYARVSDAADNAAAPACHLKRSEGSRTGETASSADLPTRDPSPRSG